MKDNLNGFKKYFMRGVRMKEGLKVVVFFSILLGLGSWSFGAEVELTGA